MEKLTVQQGDSITIAFVLPPEKMGQLEDFSVYLGNKNIGKKSDGTLIATADPNVFLCKITSNFTQNLTGQYHLTIAVDYSDFGVKKNLQDNSLLFFVKDNNSFANDSTSEYISATIIVNIINSNLIQDIIIATIYRGYNALEMYRIEKNLPLATITDMINATDLNILGNFERDLAQDFLIAYNL